jgi:enoyl-CoA hydratase/carnithine racemase
MSKDMSTDIAIEVKDGVQIVRFLRAAKKNAFTGAMYNAMSAALIEAEANDAIAVHLFIGSGGVFSAGNDINDFLRRAEASGPAGPGGIPAPSLDFIRCLPKVTKPMLAAVDGLAVGIGTTLLFHCDLVYATPSASLRTPFLDLGLVQEAGSSILAPERLGYPRAFELICLGEPFSAERALAAGLINAIVPAAELEARALSAAARLVAKPRQALLTARQLMRRRQGEISSMIDAEARCYAELMAAPEAREAFTAFLEKRPADFAKLRKPRT